MHRVESHLDDVLNHPDDTSFSYRPLLDELKRIKQQLESIEQVLKAIGQ